MADFVDTATANDDTMSMLKVAISHDSDGHEQMWMIVVDFDKGPFVGILDNDGAVPYCSGDSYRRRWRRSPPGW